MSTSGDPKHAKITTYTQINDTTYELDVKSYYEDLASRAFMIEQHLPTDLSKFLQDVISCLDVMSTGKTKELNINIKAEGSYGTYRPRLITQTYLKSKESFKKK